MDTNSTRRVWGALDSFRSQFERPSKGNFVNVAPPQLSEEVPRVHRASPGVLMGANIFSTSASKRGSLRIGSHTGSSLKKDPIAPAARPRSNHENAISFSFKAA